MIQKIANAIFHEPAILGFKWESDKLIPFFEPIPTDKKSLSRLTTSLEQQLDHGEIASADLVAAKVRLNPPYKIPQDLAQQIDHRGFIYVKLHRPSDLPFLNTGDPCHICKITNNTGKEIFVLTT